MVPEWAVYISNSSEISNIFERSKYRGDWHIVQRIISRSIYDLATWLEMDKNSDLYKEEEQILIELLIDEELVTTPLNMTDLSSNEVEADFVFNLDDSKGDD